MNMQGTLFKTYPQFRAGTSRALSPARSPGPERWHRSHPYELSSRDFLCWSLSPSLQIPLCHYLLKVCLFPRVSELPKSKAGVEFIHNSWRGVQEAF